MNSSLRHKSGFTLIELIVVVTVAGILAAIALPSFSSLNQSQRVKNASFDLYSVLNLARSEAIKRNDNVTVALIMAGSALTRIDVTASGTLLYTKSAPKKVAITPSANAVSGITYRRTGRPSAAMPTFQIDVEGAAPPTTNVRCITIGLSGVANSRKGAC